MDIKNIGFLEIANLSLDELELETVLFDQKRNVSI